MLINSNTAISTSKVLLVPYSKWHVPRYHEWMKDEEIQQATASEPLTLPAEYAMQQSWRQDADKLTFIVCLPLLSPSSSSGNGQGLKDEGDASDRMLGDINLFLRVEDEDEEEEKEGSSHPQIVGEIELMIAEKQNQRKGYGKASLLSFLKYIVDHERELLSEFVNGDPVAKQAISTSTSNFEEKSRLKLSCLSVKIGQSNTRSLALFESLSFEKVSSEPNFFGEFELRRTDLSPGVVEGELRGAGVEGYVEVVYRQNQ